MSRITSFGLLIVALLTVATPLSAQTSAELVLGNFELEVDRLAPGATSGSAQIVIDAGASRATIDVNASISGLVVSITGPSGQTIDPTTIAGFNGAVSQFSGSAGGEPTLSTLALPGNHTVFEFDVPEAGVYTVNFDGGVGLGTEVAVVTSVTTDSQLGLALFVTESTLFLGRTVVLGAALFNAAAPVSGANISVAIASDGGESGTVNLFDDGSGADQVSGDGIYTGTYVPLSTGTFRATTRVAGSLPGLGAYSRMGATGFLIVPQSGIISGTFTESILDTNSNGLAEAIRLAFDLNIVTAGDYNLVVFLESPLGVRVASSGTLTLPAGMGGQIPVDFAAADLRAVGEDGPYMIDEVELTYIDPTLGSLVVDQGFDLGSTSAFLQSSLERDPIIVTGMINDQAFDDDMDGLFDRLVVTVEVDLLQAGSYDWSYKISGQDLTEIDFDSDQATLGSGIQTFSLTFQGSAIGMAGLDGPFLVRDLLAQGPSGSSLVVTDLGQTSNYTASQFAGFTGGTPPAFSASSGCDVEFRVEAGNPFTHIVSAMDADMGDSVTVTVANLPPGATLTPAPPAVGNPVALTMVWTPTKADLGLVTVTFTATDQTSRTTDCNVLIRVVANSDPDGGGCGGCSISTDRDGAGWYDLLPLLLLAGGLYLSRRRGVAAP